MVGVSVNDWKKSSYCEASGCIEVATAPTEVQVRDSKNPDGWVLNFDVSSWREFIAAFTRDIG